MLKASAMYIAIIIASVIAIFSASLIATAYFYRLEIQKNQRYSRLAQNLDSGTALTLSAHFTYTNSAQQFDLFGNATDSLVVKKQAWGLFDYATIASFTLRDTLRKSFLIAKDTNKDRVAVYLSDEDHPLSVSGNTQISGDAYIPKAGIKQAYVEGKPFKGKNLVNGNVKDSNRKLPTLDFLRLAKLNKWLKDSVSDNLELTDSLFHSFFVPTGIVRLKGAKAIINTSLKGNIIVLCDSVVTIKAVAQLEDVMVFAPGIVVEKGFKGTCQLFAKDSIVVERDVIFQYPSCLGVLKQPGSKVQAKIAFGDKSLFSGIIFTYEEARSDLQTLISIGKDSEITGDVFATGLLKMERPLTIKGKVYCNRFIIQTPTTLYENYLIDITLNRQQRSSYFLSSGLFESFKNSDSKILKWLN